MLMLALGRVTVVRVGRRTPLDVAAPAIADGVPFKLTLVSP
jgi:hypothetical protein